MPERMCAIVKGKSGLAAKHSLVVHDGVIDPDCRGEIKVIIHNFSDNFFIILFKKVTVAQLLFIETISLLFVQNTIFEYKRYSKHLCFE